MLQCWIFKSLDFSFSSLLCFLCYLFFLASAVHASLASVGDYQLASHLLAFNQVSSLTLFQIVFVSQVKTLLTCSYARVSHSTVVYRPNQRVQWIQMSSARRRVRKLYSDHEDSSTDSEDASANRPMPSPNPSLTQDSASFSLSLILLHFLSFYP